MRPPQTRQQARAGGVQAAFMKLRPYERVLAIMAAVLVIASVFVFQSYRQAQIEKGKLSKQLAGVDRGVASVKRDYDLDALRKKQADLTEELKGPGSPWFKKLESLDVDNLITASAVQNRVDVVRLSLGKDSKKKIGNVEYQVDLRQVVVKGDLANMVRFIDQIERGQLSALRLSNIKMNLVKGTWNGSFDVELWSLPE